MRQIPPAPLTMISSAPANRTLLDSDRLESQRRAGQSWTTPPARPTRGRARPLPPARAAPAQMGADLLAAAAADGSDARRAHQPAAVERRLHADVEDGQALGRRR